MRKNKKHNILFLLVLSINVFANSKSQHPFSFTAQGTKKLQVVSPSAQDVPAPRPSMGDRTGYLGASNGEHIYYGPLNEEEQPARHPHWLERQAFWLGLKFEIDSVHFHHPAETKFEDHYVVKMKRERDRVRWWAREPKYLDTAGLTEIPSGIDARRFLDKDGINLIGVDNFRKQSGLSLKLKGRNYPIEARELAIIEAE